MSDCIFCKIIKSEIPSKKIYEDEKVLAFYDISPEAPVHFLVIPKEHIVSANDITEKNAEVVSHIFVVNNCGEQGGQTVGHMHFHVLGARDMKWPPG